MTKSKFYCYCCKHQTHHKVLFEHIVDSNTDEVWWRNVYRIVQCCGCDHVSFNLETVDESMVRYDPIEQSQILEPEFTSYPRAEHELEPIEYTWDFPSSVYGVYRETINAINQKSYCLAAAGCRMIIEAICVEKKITNKNLEDKINSLKKKGIITEADRYRLHSIRFMGNDSVHFTKAPSREQILLVIEIINGILFNLYVIEEKIADKLESPIKTYEDFEKLLLEGLEPFEIGHVDVLRNLLPENRRLIKEDITSFEAQLKKNIEEGKFTKLELCPPPPENRRQQYKVVE